MPVGPPTAPPGLHENARNTGFIRGVSAAGPTDSFDGPWALKRVCQPFGQSEDDHALALRGLQGLGDQRVLLGVRSPREDAGRRCAAATWPNASRSTWLTSQTTKGTQARSCGLAQGRSGGNSTSRTHLPSDFARHTYSTLNPQSPKSSFVKQCEAEVRPAVVRKKKNPARPLGGGCRGGSSQSGESTGDAQQSVGQDTHP